MAASGSNVRLTYIQETTWGTTPATPNMKVLRGVTSESLGAETEQLISNEINSSRGRSYSKPGQKRAGGDISFELGVKGIVSAIGALFGSVATSGIGPYTHEITVGQGPKSWTLEKNFTDINQIYIFRGVKPNSFNLSIDPNGIVTGSINTQAKNVESTTTTLDATPVDGDHAFYDGIRGSVLVGGVSYDMLTFSLEGTNNIEDARAIGKDESVGLTAQMFDLTGSFSIPYINNVVVDKALNGDEDDILITLTNDIYSIEFNLPRIQYSGDPIPKPNGTGQANVEVSFTALLDNNPVSPTYKKSCVITVVNDEAVL